MTRHRLIFSGSVLLTILIGYSDHQTGAHVSMMLLYAVPILVCAWFCGKLEGIIVAIAASGSWLIVNIIHQAPEQSDAILSWNAFTRCGIFVLIAYTVSLQAQLRKALEREKVRADTDRLTGLFNKGAYRERVDEEINRARRYNHPLSLAFIDLDNFKLVNDSQGHVQGDTLLQQFSGTISNTIRKTDIVGRIGGDEFSICYPETDEEQVRIAIEKLFQAFANMWSKYDWQITASIGVVTCAKCRTTYDTLLGKADELMYVAKGKGKNTARFMTI